MAVGTGLVLIGFTNMEIWGVESAKFLTCIAIGFILILFFIFRESRSTNPLLNFTVLRYQPFAIAFLINCVIAMSLGITGILVAVYVQTILGYSPMEAGLILLRR